MRSNLKILAVAAVSLWLAACTVAEKEKPTTDHTEDNIVGTLMSAVSSNTSESGADQAKIAMYDPVVCRIHQFDMDAGKWERTLTPAVLHGNHKVMFEPNGNFVIDVVDKNLSVFDQNGRRQDPNVNFVGAPKNASFRPALGSVVMQDDSKTAVLMKINSAGTVTGNLSLGQILYNDVSMTGGDIDDFGNLILASTDGKIQVIDIQQTITNHDWVILSSFNTGLPANVNWLAPMHDGSHQILAKTGIDNSGNTTMAIFDTSTGTQVGTSYVVPSSRLVIKTSKLYDPHFIVQDDTTVNPTSTIVYAAGGQILHVTITNPIRNILSSRISVASNTWAIVDTDIWKIWDPWSSKWYEKISFDDYNFVQQNRLLQKFSLTRMTPLQKFTVPDTTQIQVGENKIFQLFPSNAGQALNTLIAHPEQSQPIDKFNYPFLHVEACQ